MTQNEYVMFETEKGKDGIYRPVSSRIVQEGVPIGSITDFPGRAYKQVMQSSEQKGQYVDLRA